MSATVSLQQDIYQGTHVGSSVAWPSGTTSCTATGLISNQDVSNASNSLSTFGIEASWDGGKTWSAAAYGPWQGGQADPKNPGNFISPSILVSYVQNQPTHVRANVVAPQSLSIGSSLAFA